LSSSYYSYHQNQQSFPTRRSSDLNGMIDTNEAVTETRKKGIEVIGHFIADGEINEQQETMMKSIYGKEHMLIPDVNELPGQFARSEEHTSELQSRFDLVCRLLLEK